MFSLYTRKWDPRLVYLILSGGQSMLFSFIFGVGMIYQVQTVGLSPLQLVLVGTTLEVSIFLFEVPTGIVADVYSRRLSIVIGVALIGLGFMIEGLFPFFGAILIGEMLWGIGYTFTSGSTQAWITDEIGEDKIGAVFLRGSRISNLTSIIGIISGMVLGSVLINLPIVLGGSLLIALAVTMVLIMPETGFKPAPRENRSNAGQMAHTLRAGINMVRGRPILLSILGIGLFYGLFSEGFDRLGTSHLLKSFTLPDFGGLQPVVWLGLMGIVGNLLSAGALRVIEKRVDMTLTRPVARAAFIVSALMMFGLFGFALAGTFFMAVIMSWGINIMRTLLDPLYNTWMNQHIDSNVRATVISMNGQVDAIGQIGGGPPVGLVGERFGVRVAIFTAGLILSPVLVLYMRVLRKDKNSLPAVVALEESSAA